MKALPLLVVLFVAGERLWASQTAPQGRVSTPPRIAAKPSPTSSVDPKRCAPCVVEIEFREVDGVCEAVKPSSTHKVGHVAPGDAVRWVAKNGCATPMEFGIDHFRGHSRSRCTTPADHDAHEKEKPENPLEPSCAHKVTPVAARGSNDFKCSVRKNAIGKRTYEYDIVGVGRVLVDPEMEIYP
jgi:hypothetical protein